MSGELPSLTELDDTRLRVRYSLQQLPQIIDALTPHLPAEVAEEFTRIAGEVIISAAENAGIEIE